MSGEADPADGSNVTVPDLLMLIGHKEAELFALRKQVETLRRQMEDLSMSSKPAGDS